MNQQWHTAHPLGRGADESERIAWHRAHQLNCACRPIPKSLLGRVEPGASAIERAYLRLKARFEGTPRVTTGGKGFGASALKASGKIFAMLSSRQEFVLKLPHQRVTELVGAGRGRHFDAGKGKRMKEWLVVDLPPARWFALANEARRFVDPGSK